jgi:hypothetical protein
VGVDLPQNQAPNPNPEDGFISVLLTMAAQHRLGLRLVNTKDAIDPLKKVLRQFYIRTDVEFPIYAERHISHQVPYVFIHHSTVLWVMGRKGVIGWERRRYSEATFVAAVRFEVAGYGGSEGRGGAMFRVVCEDLAGLLCKMDLSVWGEVGIGFRVRHGE